MHQLDISVTENRVIGNALRTQAATVGDDVFLMFGDRALTFARANDLANSYDEGLRRLGVGPADRVCALMGNSREFALTALAVNKLGAVWVPVNTTYRGAWLRDTLADARAALLVVDELFKRVRALGESKAGEPSPVRRALRLGLREPVTEAGIEGSPAQSPPTAHQPTPRVVVDRAEHRLGRAPYRK
jgi:acyl-CoA synthetase (AMP-forming)/AMP-acid ligase II